MNGVLLDTNALLWLLADDPSLGSGARAVIQAGATVHFSAVSVLEVTMKVMLGKLTVPGDVADAARAAGLSELAFGVDAARGVALFPELVRHDPFDRMILAQAVAAELTLYTSDRTLLALGRVDVIDARR